MHDFFGSPSSVAAEILIKINKHLHAYDRLICSLLLKQPENDPNNFFLAHLSTECSVSYCDHLPSVDVRPSVHNFLVNTLASTNIDQSAPNLIKMYMTIRSRMSSIMELSGLEMSNLSALELENLPYFTLFTPISTKLGHNIYAYKISDEFDNVSN